MAAGEVDFPSYMKDWHEDKLNDIAGDMSHAKENNPYENLSPYDPSSKISEIISATADFFDEIDAIDKISDWNEMVTASGYESDVIDSMDPVQDWKDFVQAASDNVIGVQEFDDKATDQLEAETLPRFRAGMRNIGAVMTSAFAIGESNLYAFKNRDVNQHASQVAQSGVQLMSQLYERKKRFQNEFRSEAIQTMLQIQANRLNSLKAWASAVIEGNRIAMVSEKEHTETEIHLAKKEAQWPLEVYQYGANLLASISGAPTVTSAADQPSDTRSAVGGALSGAALGGAIASSTGISSGWGAAGGAAVGAGLSLL